jgi:hypothetical protein
LSNYTIGWNKVVDIKFNGITLAEFGEEYVPDDWFYVDKVNEKYFAMARVFFGDASASKTDVSFRFKDYVLAHNGVAIEYECLEYADAGKSILTCVNVNKQDIIVFLRKGQLPYSTHEV